jgi:hypothetical protein
MAPSIESETESGYYQANPYSIPDTSNPDRFTTSMHSRSGSHHPNPYPTFVKADSNRSSAPLDSKGHQHTPYTTYSPHAILPSYQQRTPTSRTRGGHYQATPNATRNTPNPDRFIPSMHSRSGGCYPNPYPAFVKADPNRSSAPLDPTVCQYPPHTIYPSYATVPFNQQSTPRSKTGGDYYKPHTSSTPSVSQQSRQQTRPASRAGSGQYLTHKSSVPWQPHPSYQQNTSSSITGRNHYKPQTNYSNNVSRSANHQNASSSVTGRNHYKPHTNYSNNASRPANRRPTPMRRNNRIREINDSDSEDDSDYDDDSIDSDASGEDNHNTSSFITNSIQPRREQSVRRSARSAKWEKDDSDDDKEVKEAPLNLSYEAYCRQARINGRAKRLSAMSEYSTSWQQENQQVRHRDTYIYMSVPSSSKSRLLTHMIG